MTLPIVFVSSSGRSGSKSLVAALGSLPNVRAFHGPAHPAWEAFNLATRLENGHEPGPLLETLRRRVDETHDAGCAYVEVTWCMAALAPLLRARYPSCRIYHLVRDPRDFVRSGMAREWFTGDPGYLASVNACSRDLWPHFWSVFSRMGLIAAVWDDQQGCIEDGEPDARVRFEEMLAVGVVPEFFGLPPCDRVPLPRENATEKHVLPPWREWPSSDLEKVWQIVGPTAERYGYRKET